MAGSARKQAKKTPVDGVGREYRDGKVAFIDVPAGVSLKSLELHDSPFSGGVKVPLRA